MSQDELLARRQRSLKRPLGLKPPKICGSDAALKGPLFHVVRTLCPANASKARFSARRTLRLRSERVFFRTNATNSNGSLRFCGTADGGCPLIKPKSPLLHSLLIRLSSSFNHSILSAFIGSMLAARLAGMKPANAADAESTNTAPMSVSGS